MGAPGRFHGPGTQCPGNATGARAPKYTKWRLVSWRHEWPIAVFVSWTAFAVSAMLALAAPLAAAGGRPGARPRRSTDAAADRRHRPDRDTARRRPRRRAGRCLQLTMEQAVAMAIETNIARSRPQRLNVDIAAEGVAGAEAAFKPTLQREPLDAITDAPAVELHASSHRVQSRRRHKAAARQVTPEPAMAWRCRYSGVLEEQPLDDDAAPAGVQPAAATRTVELRSTPSRCCAASRSMRIAPRSRTTRRSSRWPISICN